MEVKKILPCFFSTFGPETDKSNKSAKNKICFDLSHEKLGNLF